MIDDDENTCEEDAEPLSCVLYETRTDFSTYCEHVVDCGSWWLTIRPAEGRERQTPTKWGA